MKKSGKLFVALALAFGLSSCGGSGSGASSDQITVTSAVSTPTTNLSIVKDLRAQGIFKTVTEAPQAGVQVQLETLTGTVVTRGITDSSGNVSFANVPRSRVEGGLMLVTSSGVPLHAVEVPTAAQIATGTVNVPINTESDFSFAAAQSECSNNVASCPLTDLHNFVAAMEAFVGSGDPATSSVGGYSDALLAAHAHAITAFAAGGTPPADALAAAWGGNTTAFLAQAGSTISNVPVPNAITNAHTAIDSFHSAYFARSDAASPSLAENLVTQAADTFDPAALVGVFRSFTPSEIGQYQVADFQGFANALPNLSNGFAAFGQHSEAQQSLAQQFRLGAFSNSSRAAAALGFLAATFPSDLSFSSATYDPAVAARAANNGFLQYASTGGDFTLLPSTFVTQFAPVLGDPTHRQAWDSGGSSACSSYISGFVANPTGFVPGNFIGTIPAPAGGSCTRDADCAPCTSCTNRTCVMLAKVGTTCTGNNDCDNLTSCIGGFFTGATATCQCSAGVPPGAFQEGSGGPHQLSGPPVHNGETGGLCGTGVASCGSGNTCTGSVCVPSTFQRLALAPCSSNGQCLGGTCTGGLCAAGAGAGCGSRQSGSPCGGPSDCASCFCSGGTCGSPPSTFSSAEATLLANGVACNGPAQCQSAFCNVTCQAAPTAGGGSGGASSGGSGVTGSFCTSGSQCGPSLFCNVMTNQCQPGV